MNRTDWDHAFYPVLLYYSLCQVLVCAICGEREHP